MKVIVILFALIALTLSTAFALTSEEATKIVTATYQDLLQRQPDPMGLQGWVDFLLTGGTETQFRAMVLASEEYALLQARPDIAPFLPPGPLLGTHGQMVLNGKPMNCPSGLRQGLVENLSGRIVEIRLVRTWHGASPGAIVDISSQVFRRSDFSLVGEFGQDRYSNPGGPTHADTSLAVPLLLPPGDALIIHYGCGSPAPPNVGIQAHVVVKVWWTWGP